MRTKHLKCLAFCPNQWFVLQIPLQHQLCLKGTLHFLTQVARYLKCSYWPIRLVNPLVEFVYLRRCNLLSSRSPYDKKVLVPSTYPQLHAMSSYVPRHGNAITLRSSSRTSIDCFTKCFNIVCSHQHAQFHEWNYAIIWARLDVWRRVNILRGVDPLRYVVFGKLPLSFTWLIVGYTSLLARRVHRVLLFLSVLF